MRENGARLWLKGKFIYLSFTQRCTYLHGGGLCGSNKETWPNMIRVTRECRPWEADEGVSGLNWVFVATWCWVFNAVSSFVANVTEAFSCLLLMSVLSSPLHGDLGALGFSRMLQHPQPSTSLYFTDRTDHNQALLLLSDRFELTVGMKQLRCRPVWSISSFTKRSSLWIQVEFLFRQAMSCFLLYSRRPGVISADYCLWCVIIKTNKVYYHYQIQSSIVGSTSASLLCYDHFLLSGFM